MAVWTGLANWSGARFTPASGVTATTSTLSWPAAGGSVMARESGTVEVKSMASRTEWPLASA